MKQFNLSNQPVQIETSVRVFPISKAKILTFWVVRGAIGVREYKIIINDESTQSQVLIRINLESVHTRV